MNTSIRKFLPTFTLICTFFSLPNVTTANPPVPEQIKGVVHDIFQHSIRKENLLAAQLAISNVRTDASWEENAILEFFALNQFAILKNWAESERLLLKLLEYPDFNFEMGLFSIGQKSAAVGLMERMASSQNYILVTELAKKILSIRPTWKQIDDHSLAGFWTTLGEAQFKNAEPLAAIESWKNARNAWNYKKKLWMIEEPEKFVLYKGLHRFNPLELSVSATLLGAFQKMNRHSEARAILESWQTQIKVLELVQQQSELPSAKIFRRTLLSALREAETFLEVPDLVQLLASTSSSVQCGKVFNSK